MREGEYAGKSRSREMKNNNISAKSKMRTVAWFRENKVLDLSTHTIDEMNEISL